MVAHPPTVLEEITEQQCGVLTRRQALACGLTDEMIEARLAGRWQRVYRSIYVVHNGPLSRGSALWAAVLRAGDDAVLSHYSAAERAGLVDQPTDPIHISVPSRRRVSSLPGVVVHRSNRAAVARHPTRLPPQTRIEETVVDLTQMSRTVEQALGWIVRACGRRLTRPERITAAIAARKKVRWREELLVATGDAGTGSHSPLELRYLRDVERAHRLPTGSRQHTVARPGGRYYDDVRYPELGVVIELDGRIAHPDDVQWRDMRRDNASVLDGRRTLRYGWADVAGRPCEVAAQVATVLRAGGWRGMARPCRPSCPVITETFPSWDTEKSP
jgi:very-short-patch-repair endonuclease